jgi:hypothetical protein
LRNSVEKAMKLRFGQIEEVLRDVHGVPPDQHSQFRAKLRNLFRVGLSLPSGSTGRQANFHPADLFKLAFTVELMQAGLPPEKAVLTVARYWPHAVELLFHARKALQDRKPVATYLVAEPHAMSSQLYTFRPETGAALAKRLASGGESFSISRLVVINPASLLYRIMASAAMTGLDADALGASLDEDQAIILEQGSLINTGSGFVRHIGGEGE